MKVDLQISLFFHSLFVSAVSEVVDRWILSRKFWIWAGQGNKRIRWVISVEIFGIYLWRIWFMISLRGFHGFQRITRLFSLWEIVFFTGADSQFWIQNFIYFGNGRLTSVIYKRDLLVILSNFKIGFGVSEILGSKQISLICSLWWQGNWDFGGESLDVIFINMKKVFFLITFKLALPERKIKHEWVQFLFCSSLRNVLCFLLGETMAQLVLNKKKDAILRTETVSIPESVLAQHIQQFSLTLIGRLMNPSIQRMDSLVANMPKIWKMEDKVVGADLGHGIFQFNFQSEEDLIGVLKNVPYHFDGWMVSLVRWEPIISSSYPSAINFWVKVTGIPMHLWEEQTLQAVGKKVGLIRDVDVDSGSVNVTVNGFNPLVFKLIVPFAWGDEVVVNLEYDKLANFCKFCLRLTHDVALCPELHGEPGRDIGEHNIRRPPPNKLMSNQGNEGGWEKQRKSHAKRALEFNGNDIKEGHPSKRDGMERQFQKCSDKSHSLVWNKADSSGTLRESNSEPVNFGMPAISKSWPKSLTQLSDEAKESQSLPQLSEVSTLESADKVMEDGEIMDTVGDTKGSDEQAYGDETDLSQDGGTDFSEKADGQIIERAKEGIHMDVATRTRKKGTVALPKPPADT